MGWEIGYDTRWSRDVGYGVPAYCDEPGCSKEIDRGLSYVCGGEPYGGDYGCGLFFCGEHQQQECMHEGYTATPDQPRWIAHKLIDPSWKEWRDENTDWVIEAFKSPGFLLAAQLIGGGK